MWSKAGGGALRSRTCMARAAGITAVVKHVVTLPVEFDASFNRALLLLKEGRFVPDHELGAARHILSAAAYTYVAAALVDLINVARLLRGVRF